LNDVLSSNEKGKGSREASVACLFIGTAMPSFCILIEWNFVQHPIFWSQSSEHHFSDSILD
jgi:hypothetical protein